uniref:Lysosomal Pro-X carboxypeptidase n=1 Tax=Plectus sambesii TaxID=2011161 RepID=A0A914WMS2_9BILA
MPVDHFSYRDARTFNLRYFINVDHYLPGGPIFFYCGNEGELESFALNTGIMWDLAPNFNAAVVFAEHRYYGKSFPFGNADNSTSTLENIGYLSSQQAIADYAVLITYLKSHGLSMNATGTANAPVVAFGGSYGGMLAAWFRMKYPHIIVGAHASSAPVLLFLNANGNFDGMPDPASFYGITGRTFQNAGCNPATVQRAWAALANLAKSADGRNFLNNQFNLCSNMLIQQASDVSWLINYIEDSMVSMAMVDYPYPNSFLGPIPVPAWPAKVACANLNFTVISQTSDQQLAAALNSAVNVFYNSTGAATGCVCANLVSPICTQGLAQSAQYANLSWPWQTCTEMALPSCVNGSTDSFFPSNVTFSPNLCPWTPENQANYCQNTFSYFDKELFRPTWAMTYYGKNFAAASNIIFSNGNLDPWAAGGVFSSAEGIVQAQRNGVTLIEVEESGHHLDLRQPNTCDPPSVIEARRKEYQIIYCWVVPASCSSFVPPSEPPASVVQPCKYVYNGYPWAHYTAPQSGSADIARNPAILIFMLVVVRFLSI